MTKDLYHWFTQFQQDQNRRYSYEESKEKWKKLVSDEISAGNTNLQLIIQDFNSNINCKSWDFSNVDLTISGNSRYINNFSGCAFKSLTIKSNSQEPRATINNTNYQI